MERSIQLTADGSSTIFVPELNQHYHSTHGALQESMHVFIEAGLKNHQAKQLSILEIGFGTGLNAWLTAIEAKKVDKKVSYVGVEKHPVSVTEAAQLNYTSVYAENKERELFTALHVAEWEKEVPISPYFSLLKKQLNFLEIADKNAFDIIYFDAFAPNAQPELWTEELFGKMFLALKTGGFLVTYCAKGQVKRNLKSVGFTLESLLGPPGKREMTRALKVI